MYGAAVLDAAREDIVAFRRARYQLLMRITEIHEHDLAAENGYRSTRRLIEQLWRVDAGEAGRLVADATDLIPGTSMTGEPIPATLPATGEAAAAGLVGEAHVRVVRRTMEHLGRVDGLDTETLEASEQILAKHATNLPPKSLEKAAHRLVSNLDEDGAAPPEDPELGDEVHIGQRDKDTLALTARLHGRVEVEMIKEVLDALSTSAGPDDHRSLAKRRAEALKDLFAQALAPAGIAAEAKAAEQTDTEQTDTEQAATEQLKDDDADETEQTLIPAPRQPVDEPAPAAPTKSYCPTVRIGGQALLTITMDYRSLQQQVGHGVLDSDTAVHPGSVRRWACDACVVPVILGTDSQPLDIGRLTRTVSDGMRRALIHRDGGCSFPGCTRRPKRCHAHHVRHWIDGGETKLENLALLCRFHHGVIHHDQWTVEMVRGRPWFTPPAWVDPDRIARPGGRYPVPA
jgi:hypothetical protein